MAYSIDSSKTLQTTQNYMKQVQATTVHHYPSHLHRTISIHHPHLPHDSKASPQIRLLTRHSCLDWRHTRYHACRPHPPPTLPAQRSWIPYQRHDHKEHKRTNAPFRLIYSSPKINHNDMTIRTKAYAIEIKRSDAATSMKILKTTFADTRKFLIAKLRFTHPASYANALRLQTQHLSSTYVIPIVNITPDILFYLKPHIDIIAGVNAIVPTKSTNSHGWYHILVRKDHFKKVKQHLQDNLDTLYNEVPMDARKTPTSFTGLPQLNTRSDDSTGGNSFLSLSAQSFASLELSSVDDNFHYPPPTSSAYSWADITSNTPSRPLPPQRNRSTEHNRKHSYRNHRRIKITTQRLKTNSGIATQQD